MGVTALPGGEHTTQPKARTDERPAADPAAPAPLRRPPRARRPPPRLRSPSPQPVVAAATPPPRTTPKVRAKPGAADPRAPRTPAVDARAPRAPAPAAHTPAPAAVPAEAAPAHAAPDAATPAAHADAHEASDTPEELGPGKRHRRPSTMYRPPEALTTSEQKRTSTAPVTASPTPAGAPASSGKAKSARPGKASKGGVRVKEDAAPTAAPVRTLPKITILPRHSPPAKVDESAPATFIRHGERIEAPVPRHRRRTPEPAPVSASVMEQALPLNDDDDDEEDEEEDEDVADVVARAPLPPVAHESPPAGPAPLSAFESDNEEDDFHETMLDDSELDALDGEDESPAPAPRDTPASGTRDTPAASGAPPAVCASSPEAEGSSTPSHNTVFSHALPPPCPLSAERGTHAGQLTLSLPFENGAVAELTASVGSSPVQGMSKEVLDAHNVSAALLAANTTPSLGADDTLPSELPGASAPEEELATSAASPLSDEAESPSTHYTSPDSSREEEEEARKSEGAEDDEAPAASSVSLHLGIHAEHARQPSDQDEVDTFFASHTMMGLTELHRAWDSAQEGAANGAKSAAPRRDAPPHTKRARAAAPAVTSSPLKRARRAGDMRTPRLRSRAA